MDCMLIGMTKKKRKEHRNFCSVSDAVTSSDLSQRRCYVPLPDILEPHDPVKFSCSIFASYLLEQNKLLDFY